MKQPTLFISYKTALDFGKKYLRRCRVHERDNQMRITSVSRLDNDTKEYERGFVVCLTGEASGLFL